VKSTSRIEFLISIPIRAIIPMMAVKDRELPVRARAETAPNSPSGMMPATTRALLNRPNSRTSTARMPKMAMVMAAPRPEKLSDWASAWPP